MMLYAFGRLAEELPGMLEWQPILRNGWTLETTLSESQQRTLAEHPEYADIVRRMKAAELSTVEEPTQALVAASTVRAERDGTNAKLQPIVDQGLNQLRVQGTYVDLAEAGLRTPIVISENQAYSV